MNRSAWLFTDFGWQGPYVGQLRHALWRSCPDLHVVDLMHDAPTFRADAAGHLLAALARELIAGDLVVGVVDPGVGCARRKPVALLADGCWFVGPGNGLFDVVAARARDAEWFRIDWRPEKLSASFHGRDLFAPVAGRLARGERAGLVAEPGGHALSGGDLPECIHADGFGNVMTGLRREVLAGVAAVQVRGVRFPVVQTFSDVPPGEPLAYGNSCDLVELAVNQGNAASRIGFRGSERVVLEPLVT